MKTVFIVICIILLIFLWWFIGGIHLEYLKYTAPDKALEICGNGNQIIYQGYTRGILGGFGGHSWYQCKQDNIWYRFYIARRINNPELQVYSFQQMTTFPTAFNLNTGK